jgi:hypothetical protein
MIAPGNFLSARLMRHKRPQISRRMRAVVVDYAAAKA